MSEPVTQEQVTQKQVTQEPVTQEQVTQEQVTQEQVTQEQVELLLKGLEDYKGDDDRAFKYFKWMKTKIGGQLRSLKPPQGKATVFFSTSNNPKAIEILFVSKVDETTMMFEAKNEYNVSYRIFLVEKEKIPYSVGHTRLGYLISSGESEEGSKFVLMFRCEFQAWDSF